MINPATIRADFPVFDQPIYGKPLVYLDTASTAQKPQAVIDSMSAFLATSYANVHRGVYNLSQRATTAYEKARATVVRFINATSDAEIVFTKNATEAVNLVAHTFGSQLQAGDRVLLSTLEHHANIVPWQMLRDRSGIIIDIIPITDDGAIDMAAFHALLKNKPKLLCITAMSNALGTITPLPEMIAAAHAAGARVLVDACQAVCHMPIDVAALDCDFMVFSGHKLYGPTGIGVLYGKAELLSSLPPFLGGGDMIDRVTFEHTTYAPSPRRFEAGTPPIAEAIGLAAAIDYLQTFGMQAVAAHEAALTHYATETLRGLNNITLYGTAANKGGIMAFNLHNTHAQDVATLLDQMAIAVRVGHHCCMPLMQRLNTTSTMRASFGIYTTHDDIDALAHGLRTAQEMIA